MPYLTGGGAYGNIEATLNSAVGSIAESESRLGFTVGAGLEYAFLSNWTAKLEYLYVDLGKFQSVLCAYDTEARTARYRTVATDPEAFRRALGAIRRDRVVFEVCSIAGW